MKEKVAEFINVIFGFRKFILMLLIYFFGIVFRLKDLLTGAEMGFLWFCGPLSLREWVLGMVRFPKP